MQYYDPERDDPVKGLIVTSRLLAYLCDLFHREQEAEPSFNLSPEGLAGQLELFHMMQQCVHAVAQQLHDYNAWKTAVALNDYLRTHPEAEDALQRFLNEARERGFTSWLDIPLE